jgi:nucleotide-binding universal stress UspA family protein
MTRISHILCPVDFSEGSRHAVARAAALARRYRAGLTLLHIFVSRPAMDVPPLVLDPSSRQQLIDELRELADAAANGVHVDCQVRQGEFADLAILDCIDDQDPDLLVLSTHGRSGPRRLFLGSVAEKVLRRAHCPTLVVPPRVPPVHEDVATFTRILCAVDFSESSTAALAQALDLAVEGTTLTLLHAVELPPVLPDLPPGTDFSAMAQRLEADAHARLQALIPAAVRGRCRVEIAVVEGRAYREIVREATERHTDLIVLGVHGRGVVDLLLFGSTAYHVVRAAACPVLVVHSENGIAAWRRHREQRAARGAAPAASPRALPELRS